MKKTYEKPRIYMERFELAEHIATGCSSIMSHGDYVSCALEDGQFAPGNVCTVPVEVYCVTNGEINLGTFSS